MSLSISLDVWRIFVCVYYINAYVNEYTVACNECNFCLMPELFIWRCILA